MRPCPACAPHDVSDCQCHLCNRTGFVGDGLSANFTDDEIECLIRTAAEMVGNYDDTHDVLSSHQVHVANKAWKILMEEDR